MYVQERLTIAPVTMAVFSSAKPTVTARLVCPAAARDSNATITKANKLSLSPGTSKVCNRAAIRIRIACTKVLKSNQLRFLARARWASCANVKLPTQNLWTRQLWGKSFCCRALLILRTSTSKQRRCLRPLILYAFGPRGTWLRKGHCLHFDCQLHRYMC